MEISNFLKKGCIICIIIYAAFITFFLLWINGAFNKTSEEKTAPFEVLTEDGTVNLHLGMPKDSVILLVGTPDNFRSFSTSDNSIVEILKYDIMTDDDKYHPLSFTFENGKLENYTQH